MRLPTLYSTLDELNLDMHILGKVLQVPSQSLEDLTFTLKEEMKIKNPLPTLEKRRYKISDEVSDDYEITYEEELELAENEEKVNLSLENIEINESEPIVSVTPEYKAYFKYENHATSSMLDEFLSGDTTRFTGSISQLGTTKLKEDLELTDKEIEQLSATNDTWGSEGLDFDATTEEKSQIPVFEADDEDDGEEFVYNADQNSIDTKENQGGIDFIENKELTNVDIYFSTSEVDTSVEFTDDYELQNLDSVIDLSVQESSELSFTENYQLQNLEDVVELSVQDTDNGFDDEDIDDSDEDLDTDFEGIDTDFEDDTSDEDDLYSDFDDEDFGTSDDEDVGLESDFDESDTISDNSIEEDIDFGTETVRSYEPQQVGGTEETTVSDEDLGFVDSSSNEDLDFGESTVTNNNEDDEYINKVLKNKNIPEALKKELIRDYLETQSRGAVEVDLGTETVHQDTKIEEVVKEEEIEYKDIRHFVRDHPRCTVQDVLKHFSKKQLEHDIMVGKVIRKGKILHI